MKITVKAKSWFVILKERAETDCCVEFIVSSGWFKHFKNCYLLSIVKMSGESGNTDDKAAEEFLESLDKLIVEGNYLPERTLNLN